MRHRRKRRSELSWIGPYLVGGLLLSSVPAAVGLAFFSSQFAGPNRRAMDAAQVARHLTRGEGFSTDVLIPAALSRQGNAPRHADLTNPPLHPLGIAAVLATAHPKSARASDNALALWTMLWWLLCLALSWALAARLFGPASAVITVIALTLNVALLQGAISGDATVPLSFLVTLLLFGMFELGRIPADAEGALARLRQAAPVIWGALVGLCFLTEYTYAALVVGILAFVLILDGGARKRACLLALTGLVVVALPWLIRNLIVAGNPVATLRWYGLVSGLGDSSGAELLRSYAPAPVSTVLVMHLGSVLRRAAAHLGALRDTSVSAADVYVFGMFVVAAFVPLARPALNKLRAGLYVMIAATALAIGVAGGGAGLTPFIPIIYIIAVGFFMDYLAARRVGIRLPRRKRIPSDVMRWVIICLGLALLAVPMLLQLRQGARLAGWQGETYQRVADGLPHQFANLREALAEDVSPGAVIVTNVPWEVAWYADRPALWCPATRADLESIEREIGPVGCSLLRTPLRRPVTGRDEPLWSWLASDWPGSRFGYETVAVLHGGPQGYYLVVKKKRRDTTGSY